MSDKHPVQRHTIAALAILGALTTLTVLPARAFDLVAPLIDPLQTLPPLLATGAILPGDDGPVPCPISKDFTSPLLLTEAVDLALCNSPQIKAAWAAIKVQAGALGEARAPYLPTLSGTTSYLQTHTSYPGSTAITTTTNGRTVYGNLAWRIFDFGGREANQEAANQLLAAAMASHDATLQKALNTVIQTYFDAQTAKAALKAKGESEVIARGTLETAQRREEHGAASRGDRLQATTAMAKASLEKNRAVGDYQKALSVLVFALGVPAPTRILLADDLNSNGVMDTKSLEDWMLLAQQNHPAIVAARAQWEAARQKVAATRSEGLPTVDFSANYYQNGYPGQGVAPTQSRVGTLGIALTIPFFDGFSRTYKIRGAEALVEQREADLQTAEQNALMEVVKMHADASSSLENLVASESLLSAAQESLETSQRRYEKGAADVLEILNTQAALANAQMERIRCLAEWRSARLRLLSSAGVMGRGAVGR